MTYPRFRQDVAFMESNDGVLVRAPDQSFVVRGGSAYRLLSILLPHLDGTTALSTLLEGVPQQRAQMIVSLLHTLRGRGVVIEGLGPSATGSPAGAAFTSQRLLVNDLGDDGSGFERVLAAEVAVVGSDPATLAILESALTANGVGVASPLGVRLWSTSDVSTQQLVGLDLLVLVEVDAPPAHLLDLLRLAGGHCDVVCVLRIENQIVIGPWQSAGGPPVVESSWLRMAENGVPGIAPLLRAMAWGSGACRSVPRLPALAAEIALSSAAFEIFRNLAGVAATDLRSSLLRLDAETLRVTHEPIVVHPALIPADQLAQVSVRPTVAEPGVAPSAVAPLSLVTDDDETEYYTRFAPLVGELAGLMQRFDDDAAPQLPVKVGVLDAPATGPSPVVDFAASTVLDARLTTLERAASRYAVELHRRLDLLPLATDGERVQVADLTGWTGAEVPSRWTVAHDRRSRQVVGVPVEAVLSGAWDRAAAAFEPSLAGLAAAPTLDRAAYRSLLDAVGAHTRQRVESGDCALSEVSLTELGRLTGDPWGQVKLLMRSAAADGLSLRLFSCPAAAPFAVVVGPDHTATYAAAGSWVAAVEKAMLALLGARQLRQWAPSSTHDLADTAIDLTDARHVRPDHLPEHLTRLANEADVLADLHQEGRRALAVELTTPELRGVTEVVRTLLTRPS